MFQYVLMCFIMFGHFRASVLYRTSLVMFVLLILLK